MTTSTSPHIPVSTDMLGRIEGLALEVRAGRLALTGLDSAGDARVHEAIAHLSVTERDLVCLLAASGRII